MARDEELLVAEAILFDGATRRTVQVRDRECFHDLCDEPAEGCEIDHIEPWSAGQDGGGQRAGGLWPPQPPAPPTTVATPSGVAALVRFGQ